MINLLSRETSAAAYPCPAFVGGIAFAMALATMLTGIQEKTSFVPLGFIHATPCCCKRLLVVIDGSSVDIIAQQTDTGSF